MSLHQDGAGETDHLDRIREYETRVFPAKEEEAPLTVTGIPGPPPESKLRHGTTADIRFGGLRGDISSAMISTDFYTPTKLALGAAWRAGATTLHAALELHRWSAAPPLTATWVSHVDFEGLEIALPQGGNAGLVQCFAQAVFDGPALKTQALQAENNLLCHRTAEQLGIGVLEDHSHLVEKGGHGRLADRFVGDEDIAGEDTAVEMGNEAVKCPAQGGLAGSAAAGNEKIIVPGDLQIDVFQHRPGSLTILVGQPPDDDHLPFGHSRLPL